MRLRAYAAVAMTAAITLAGCASGRTAPSSGAGSSSATGSAPGTPGTPATPPSPGDGATPGPTVLKSALLTAADLGASFSATPNPSSGGPVSFGCPALDALTQETRRNSTQTADFTGADGHVFITEDLAGGTTADVSAAYARLKSALTACPTWTVSTGGVGGTGGMKVTLRVSPISFGGPGSAAVRLDGSSAGTEVNGYVVFEDLGSVLLGYVFFQTGGSSSQLAYYEFTQAEAKAEHVLGAAPSAAAGSAQMH